MVTQWRLMVGAVLAAPPVPGTSIRRLAVRGVASVRGKIERTAPPHRPAKKPSQARDPLPRRISRANPDLRGKMLAGSSGRFQSRFEFGNLRYTTLLRGQWPGNAIACPRGKIMPKRTSKTGSELFIVDNSDDDWKVQRYLHDWCQLSKSIDVATGYFEIGGLLGLKDEWQKVTPSASSWATRSRAARRRPSPTACNRPSLAWTPAWRKRNSRTTS